MPYPSTAPPADPRIDTVANPTVTFLSPYTQGAGCPHDLVNLESSTPFAPKLGTAFNGNSQGGTGTFPSWVTSSFGDAGTVKGMRWQIGQRGLRWQGRGPTSVPANMTIACVFMHEIPAGDRMHPAGRSIDLFGTDAGISGISIGATVNENGAVQIAEKTTGGTVRILLPGGVPRILLPGVKYAVAITAIAAGNARILNIYDYGAQAANAQFSYTGAGAISFGSVNNDINVAQAIDSSSGMTFAGVNYCAIVDNQSWDSTANTNFQNFYQDPWALARATAYTSSSGTMEPGALSFAGSNGSSVTMSLTRPKAGIWPVTANLYRYPVPGSSTTSLTPIFATSFTNSASAPATFVDSGVGADTSYSYIVEYVDSTPTTPQKVKSLEALGRTRRASARFCLWGGNFLTIANLWSGIAAYFDAARSRVAANQMVLASGSLTGTAVNSQTPGTFFVGYHGAVTNAAGTYTLNLSSWGIAGLTTTATIAYNAAPSAIALALTNAATAAGKSITFAGAGSTPTLAAQASLTCSGADVPTFWGTKTITATLSGQTAGAYLQVGSNYGNFLSTCLAQNFTPIVEAGVSETTAVGLSTGMAKIANDMIASGVATVYLSVSAPRAAQSASVTAIATAMIDAVNALDNGSTIVSLGSPAAAYYATSQGRPNESSQTVPLGVAINYGMAIQRKLDLPYYNVTTVNVTGTGGAPTLSEIAAAIPSWTIGNLTNKTNMVLASSEHTAIGVDMTASMTAQGYTAPRGAALENLDASVASAVATSTAAAASANSADSKLSTAILAKITNLPTSGGMTLAATQAFNNTGQTTNLPTTGGGGSGPTLAEMKADAATWTIGTVTTLTGKNGFKLASDGLDSIVVESGINMRQAMSPILAYAAGNTAGAGTSNVSFAAAGTPGTARITAALSGGNRTNTLNLPA
ncbi:hypothetical protein EP7_005645 (plasmid) [Isosphaeraceae bacterium EP7]